MRGIGRQQRALARGAERLDCEESHRAVAVRRLASLALLALALLGAAVLTAADGGDQKGRTVRDRLRRAFGLTEGAISASRACAPA